MSLLKTFGEIKNSRVLTVAACCADSDEFKSLVNEATEILMSRGDWPGTIVPARLMVRAGCIVWPRWVQRVRKINHCNVPLKVGSIWYDFVDHESYLGWRGAEYWRAPVSAGNFSYQQRGLLSNQGRVPTYNDVPGDTPRLIRAYCLNPADVGKTITIFGLDGNGQTLRHQDTTTGDMIDGSVITLAIPFASTSDFVQRIDSVQKEITQASVPIYAYDPVSDTMLDLAVYEPSETNPSYSKDRLFPNGHRLCSCEFTIIAMVKLAFIPVVVDSDYVLIPSTNALKKAIQSIKFGEAGDIQNQEAFLQAAVNELNHVLDNETPPNETPVNEGFLGEQYRIGIQQVI